MTQPNAVEELRARVQQRSGWDLSGVRGDLYAGALGRAAAAAARTAEAHAGHLLGAGDAEIAAFVADASVGETYFFRDPAQWDFVAEQIVPRALARRPASERIAFRAWSAGCSTGEEPYTLAMLLADRGVLDRARVLASDISPAAVAKARAGEYTHWSVRGGVDPRATRWLHDDGGKLRVDARIAHAVEFFELNLAEARYPDARLGLEGLDLVLCRNVLLYLRPSVVADVAVRLFETLAPGGWLLTSPSDPPLRRYAPYAVHVGPHGVAYQRAAQTETAVARSGSGARSPAAAARPDLVRRAHDARDARAPAQRLAPIRRAPPGARARALAVNTARVSTVASGVHQAPPDACPGCRELVDSGKLADALALVEDALRRTPLAPELHLLRAIVMADLGALREAEEACRRAIYLARDQPFLHFFLATVLSRARDVAGAAAALRTSVRLAEKLDPNEEIPWSEGMTAAELAAAARWQLGRHEAGVPAAP